jgi:hypothetical protein
MAGIHHNYKLQKDYDIYGINNFRFTVIEELNNIKLSVYKKTMLLIYKEYNYINSYSSLINGYNIENTLEQVLNGNKIIISDFDKEYLQLIINNNGMIPNKNVLNYDVNKVYLLNNVIKNTNISNYCIAAYIALRMIYKKGQSKYYLNSNIVYFMLSGNICNSRKILENLKQGILDLESIELINILERDKSNSNFIINPINFDIKDVNLKDNYYVTIDYNEITTLVNSDYSNKFKILRYFVYLITTFVKSKNYGIQTVNNMSNSLNIDDSTIYKYNDILQKLKLIYIYNSKDIYKDKDGTILGISNTYGRYKDKNIIIKSGQDHESKYGHEYLTKISKISGNKTRSASQRYNAFCNGKEYSEDKLKEIYTIIKEFNDRQSYDDKKKDLSVFSKYEFYDVNIKAEDSS